MHATIRMHNHNRRANLKLKKPTLVGVRNIFSSIKSAYHWMQEQTSDKILITLKHCAMSHMSDSLSLFSPAGQFVVFNKCTCVCPTKTRSYQQHALASRQWDAVAVLVACDPRRVLVTSSTEQRLIVANVK